MGERIFAQRISAVMISLLGTCTALRLNLKRRIERIKHFTSDLSKSLHFINGTKVKDSGLYERAKSLTS